LRKRAQSWFGPQPIITFRESVKRSLLFETMDKYQDFLAKEVARESTNVPETREKFCPNYTIPSLEENFSEYNANGPRAGIDYNSHTGRPITKLCKHSKCQPFAEYEFALICLFVKKEISLTDWKTSRPTVPVSESPYITPPPKTWCFGKTLKRYAGEGGYTKNGYSDPSTVLCTHGEGECVGASPAAIALHRLVNTDVVEFKVLQQIIKRGWGQKCEQAVFLDFDPVSTLFHVDHGYDYSHLWRPYMLDEWIDMQEKHFESNLEQASIEDDHDKVKEMQDFARIKCYYKDSGDRRVVTLKRKKDSFTVDMKSTPEVVSKLAKLWVSTGQELGVLVQAMEKITNEYKIYKESKV
jgi:hypothetical protein